MSVRSGRSRGSPRVSVVMPVYNGERYLPEAVESVLHQTFDDFEFIIVDDCSTDDTKAILESYRDSRIVHIRNRENLGLTRSLNLALDAARGEYIARMDADDFSLSSRFARQVEFLDANPQVGVVGSAVREIGVDGNVCGVLRYPVHHFYLVWCLTFYNPLVHPSTIMRSSIVKEVGGYNREMICAQDYDLWWKMSRVSCLANLQDVLLLLRRHQDSITFARAKQQWECAVAISQVNSSAIIGEHIPSSTIESLWGKRFETLHEAYCVAEFICKLWEAFAFLSVEDKRLIYNDAITRLLTIASSQMNNLKVWSAFGRFCRLNPFEAGRAVASLAVSSMFEILRC